MTGQPDQQQALDLLECLRPEGVAATGDQVIELLEAWGFQQDGLAGVDGAFLIHPRHVHLQMDVPTRGRVHRFVVQTAIDQIGCLRVLE